MQNGGPEYMVEFAHGYLFCASATCAAEGLATLDLLERGLARPGSRWRLTSRLRSARHVTGIRNYGLAAGVTLASLPGENRAATLRAAMHRNGAGLRALRRRRMQFAPSFIMKREQIDARRRHRRGVAVT